ncbi:hypothetical protein NQZ68_040310 [Dissostichus eleginoides]|nr:hypothetical protein NQZ68_040310 [Dissostichus eleginoides]
MVSHSAVSPEESEVSAAPRVLIPDPGSRDSAPGFPPSPRPPPSGPSVRASDDGGPAERMRGRSSSS